MMKNGAKCPRCARDAPLFIHEAAATAQTQPNARGVDNSQARKSDHPDGDMFDVEELQGKRMTAKGEEFFVKWQGYPVSENTWEPRRNIPIQIVQEYIETETNSAGNAGGQHTRKGLNVESEVVTLREEIRRLEEHVATQTNIRATPASVMLKHLQCPITHEVMKDPVLATDGHTYEREAIIDWFQKCTGITTSPMTNKEIRSTLQPNFSIRSLIAAYKVETDSDESEDDNEVYTTRVGEE